MGSSQDAGPASRPPLRAVPSGAPGAGAHIDRRKLARPRTPAPTVQRRALARAIERSRELPLTIVSGSLGSGKTLFGAAWAESAGTPTAWLAVDDGDNRFPRFAAHLCAAIASAAPEFACAPELAAALPPAEARDAIAGALFDLGAPLTLVLDDAERLTDPDGLRLLTDLVSSGAPGFHLVLLARSLPGLPISTLRMRGMVQELTQQDLAFSAEEAGELAAALGVDRPADEIAAIVAHTHGLAGALRLALAAEPGADGAAGHAGLDTLADDILRPYSAADRDLILRLALVDAVCPELAIALARPGSDPGAIRDLFEALAHSGLLEPRPGAASGWRRFHPVVLDLMRARLTAEMDRHDLAALHRQAFRWHAEADLLEPAIRHSLAAEMPLAACELVERWAFSRLEREDWQSVDAWLRQLPADLVDQRPKLLLASAWVAHLSGRSTPVGVLEARARAALAMSGIVDHEKDAVLAEFRLLRYTNSTLIDREPDQVIAKVRAERNVLFATRRFPLGLSWWLEGWALEAAGHSQQAISLMQQVAARESQVIDACSIRPLIGLAFAHRHGGRLIECQRVAEDIHALAVHNDLPISTGWASMFSGWMAYEQGDPDQAIARFTAAAADAPALHLQALREIMFGLATARFARGDRDGGHDAIRRLRETIVDRHATEQLAAVRAFEARVALSEGDLSAASSWAESADPDIDATFLMSWEIPLLTQARILAASGGAERLGRARDAVRRLRTRAEGAHAAGRLVEILAVSALVEEAAGNRGSAVADLAASLELGLRGGYLRTYVDLGPALAPLLEAIEDERLRPYARRLLGAVLGETERAGPAAPVSAPAAPGGRASILSVLSIREAEVLEALARRLTNAEIAAEMHISSETVKCHASNIYGKLGVGSRREAIIAAESFDFGAIGNQPREAIPPPPPRPRGSRAI